MSQEHWQSLFRRLGMRTEDVLESVVTRTRRKLHPEVPVHVIAYRGFASIIGSDWHGTLAGRVLRYREPSLPGTSELWNNLRASYARFNTDELAGVEVVGRVSQLETHAVTDEEGYFTLAFDGTGAKRIDGVLDDAERMAQSADLPVSLSLPGFNELQIDGDPVIQLPSPDARFGIISDIDDTLLVTNATSLRRMMRLTLLESSARRLAFDGIAEFYQALHAGRNPFFYVSSSPWNLYEFLTDFMQLNRIVPGPLMLRDFGIDETKFIAGSHKDHKLQQIRLIIERYPELPFILSGDSGQDDPEIYATVVEEFPGVIKAIYIRDVSDEWRRQSVQKLIARLKYQDVDMLLVPDTLAAAIHAAANGFISDDALTPVSHAVRSAHAQFSDSLT